MRLVALAFALIGTLAVVSTYSQLSATYDEPAHIAAGLELLEHGTYTLHAENPPLPRVAAATLPYLDGVRAPGTGDYVAESKALMDGRHDIDRMMMLARIGTLPFFVLLLVAAWAWARVVTSPMAATAGVFMLVTTPPLLAHAALATTDMASVATLTLTFLAATLWFDRPTRRHAVLLGVAGGLALVSKFSAIPFLGVSFAAWLVVRFASGVAARPVVPLLNRNTPWLVILPLAIFVLTYGFTFDAFRDPAGAPYEGLDRIVGADGWLHDLSYQIVQAPVFPLAFTSFADGLQMLSKHNNEGHLTYLLGRINEHGWRYYYPLLLLVRTPLPLLVLGLGGLGWMVAVGAKERRWRMMAPAAAAIAILLFLCFYAKINIGLRHTMVVYPILAMGAGYAVWRLVRGRWPARAVVAVLVVWQLVGAVAAYPHHLSYFNLLAGEHPERIAIDSDFDWGQDLHRLADLVEERGIDEIAVVYFGADRPARLIPGAYRLKKEQPTEGWVAISVQLLHGPRCPHFRWLHGHTPVATAGASIRVYNIENVDDGDDAATANACPRR